MSNDLDQLLFLLLPLCGEKSPLKVTSQNKPPTFHFEEFMNTKCSFLGSLLTGKIGLAGKPPSQPTLLPLTPMQRPGGDWRWGEGELGEDVRVGLGERRLSFLDI